MPKELLRSLCLTRESFERQMTDLKEKLLILKNRKLLVNK